MAVFGYARCSTSSQHVNGQEARLREAGCEEVFTDIITGTKASRPEWDRLLMKLRAGDTLKVTKLDRVGRSLINLVDVVNLLGERKVELVVLDGAIDTTTNNGKLIFHIMASLAEWERNLISERTVEGMKAAKARHGGKLPARGPSMTDDQIRTARELFANRESNGMSAQRIADVVGVSRATLYRNLSREP